MISLPGSRRLPTLLPKPHLVQVGVEVALVVEVAAHVPVLVPVVPVPVRVEAVELDLSNKSN
jgi:hypothetical protein